jgi:hypothetical protein
LVDKETKFRLEDDFLMSYVSCDEEKHSLVISEDPENFPILFVNYQSC